MLSEDPLRKDLGGGIVVAEQAICERQVLASLCRRARVMRDVEQHVRAFTRMTAQHKRQS